MILITGASGGIGSALLNHFKHEKEEVLGTYHEHGFAAGVRIDTTSEADLLYLAKVLSDKQQLKVIHCVGVNRNGFAHKLPLNDWQKTLDGNLTSAFLLARTVLPTMRANKFGRIIFCSSVVPGRGVMGTAAYSASKAGLWGLARTISVENAKLGVTCNCLNIGYFNAGMIRDVPEDTRAKLVEQVPVGRLGTVDELLSAVKFLFDSSYTTGTSININGGL